MSNALDVRGEAVPRPSDSTAPSVNQVGDRAVPADPRHAVRDGSGGSVPLLAQPASAAPTYRRSLFRC